MPILRFEDFPEEAIQVEVDQCGGAHREYREPVHGVKMFRNGLVELNPHVYYRPQFRNLLCKEFGLRFFIKPELVGMKLYTPEGERIIKSSLQGAAFYHDEEYKKLYALDWEGVTVFKGSQVMNDTKGVAMRMTPMQVQKLVESTENMADSLALAETMGAMAIAAGPVEFLARWQLLPWMREVAENKFPTTKQLQRINSTELGRKQMASFGHRLIKSRRTRQGYWNFLAIWYRLNTTVPYLRTEEI